MAKYLGAIDLGTGSTRFFIFDSFGNKIASFQKDLTQFFPTPQKHQQDPQEYIFNTVECMETAFKTSGLSKQDIAAIGVTNQRETVVAWDKITGNPLHRAIVWDDVRTSQICQRLKQRCPNITQKTGLPANPYFSGSKIIWLLQNVPEVQEAFRENRACFGTVDSWVLYNLVEGKPYITDISNASRTLIMNLDGNWDEQLMEACGINREALPQIVPSSQRYGCLKQGSLSGVPVCGILGDQQAALMGHKCLAPGTAKNTYGTGSFILMNTGTAPVMSNFGLLTTVFGKFDQEGPVYYALEGAIESAGSQIKWAMNSLGLVSSLDEIQPLARSVTSSEGVVFVPALSGLFTPYWRADARGLILGLNQHSTRAHIMRALLQGVSFRTAEAIEALVKDSQLKLDRLSVDGGMTVNSLFLEIQANCLGIPLEVPAQADLTALGAALAAGIGAGLYSGLEEIQAMEKQVKNVVSPSIDGETRGFNLEKWKKSVEKSFN